MFVIFFSHFDIVLNLFGFAAISLKAVDTFLEELIVRRELADNFCFYQPHYDSLKGAWGWAQTTLLNHASDKREQIYTSVAFLFMVIYCIGNHLMASQNLNC